MEQRISDTPRQRRLAFGAVVIVRRDFESLGKLNVLWILSPLPRTVVCGDMNQIKVKMETYDI